MEPCKIRKSEYPYINHEEAAKFCHVKDMKCVDKTYTKLQMRNAKAQKNACEKNLIDQISKGFGCQGMVTVEFLSLNFFRT